MEVLELIDCDGPVRGRPRLVSRRYSATGPSTTAIVKWTRKGATRWVPRTRTPTLALVGETFGPPVSWGHIPRHWREIKVWASDEGVTLELYSHLAAELRIQSPRTAKYESNGSRWLSFDWTPREATDWDYPDRLSGSWSDPAERGWLGPHPMLYVQRVEPGYMLCTVECHPAKGGASYQPLKTYGFPPVMMYRRALDDMEIVHEPRPWAPDTSNGQVKRYVYPAVEKPESSAKVRYYAIAHRARYERRPESNPTCNVIRRLPLTWTPAMKTPTLIQERLLRYRGPHWIASGQVIAHRACAPGPATGPDKDYLADLSRQVVEYCQK